MTIPPVAAPTAEPGTGGGREAERSAGARSPGSGNPTCAMVPASQASAKDRLILQMFPSTHNERRLRLAAAPRAKLRVPFKHGDSKHPSQASSPQPQCTLLMSTHLLTGTSWEEVSLTLNDHQVKPTQPQDGA